MNKALPAYMDYRRYAILTVAAVGGCAPAVASHSFDDLPRTFVVCAEYIMAGGSLRPSSNGGYHYHLETDAGGVESKGYYGARGDTTETIRCRHG